MPNSLIAKTVYSPVRRFDLGQNYPNPFNPNTTLEFSLPRAMEARLEILDARGRRVRLLFDRHWDFGRHEISWNGLDDGGKVAASGVYYYRLSTEGGEVSRKMTLLR